MKIYQEYENRVSVTRKTEICKRTDGVDCVRVYVLDTRDSYLHFTFTISVVFFWSVRNHRSGTWLIHISKIKVFRLVWLDAIEYTPQRRVYMQVQCQNRQIYRHSWFICSYYCSRLLVLLLLCLYDFVWIAFLECLWRVRYATSSRCICENVCVSHRTYLSWMRLYAVVWVPVWRALVFIVFFHIFFSFCTVFSAVCGIFVIHGIWMKNENYCHYEKWKMKTIVSSLSPLKLRWNRYFFTVNFFDCFSVLNRLSSESMLFIVIHTKCVFSSFWGNLSRILYWFINLFLFCRYTGNIETG